MSGLPWFRMYSDSVDNEKLRLIAFEDRWHFVALLCLKQQGVLDSNPDLLERKIAVKLGVQLRELDEIKRRLIEVDLIDEEFQPVGWGKKQFKREGAGENHTPIALPDNGYAYFISKSGSKEVKIGYSKNPWARVKDFNTASHEDYYLLATVRTTGNSEVELHHLFSGSKIKREWYQLTEEINIVISLLQDKKLKTVDDVVNHVEELRSTTVATTKDTDTEEDKDSERDKDKKTNISKKKKPNPLIQEVFDYWKTVLNHPKARLDANRTKSIDKALTVMEFTVDEIKEAILGCSKSPYHMGDNETKTVYDQLGLILRNAENIERFIGYADKPPVKTELKVVNNGPLIKPFPGSETEKYYKQLQSS